MQHTLEQQAQNHSNDYSSLELIYRDVTGGELVRDPYMSIRDPVTNLTLSASVIIPAWNARGTLEQCLTAIEQSSFNCRYPEKLEVIVVDDGSADGTWELLERLRLGINLKVIQQAHHSRAHTQNTGIAFAGGDVIISCDADMILTPFSIEELVKRHQVLDNVMLIGFRGDIQPADPRIQVAVLAEHLPHFLLPFTQDVRLYYYGGWPESMCRDSDHLKRLGQAKHIIMPDGSKWNLPGIVYGALFSMRRQDFVGMDGYDERFRGGGCEDTLVGVRALACHQGNVKPSSRNLGQALYALYCGNTTDIERLLGMSKEAVAAYQFVVNDGLFAGCRNALLALDELIRTMPDKVAWIDERSEIRWRNQFIFNLAITKLQCGVELDESYNIQLHAQDLQPDLVDGRAQAEWHGRPVGVVYFSGIGLFKYPQWHELFTCALKPSVGMEDGKENMTCTY